MKTNLNRASTPLSFVKFDQTDFEKRKMIVIFMRLLTSQTLLLVLCKCLQVFWNV